ncbi:MAG: hypothetical protein NWR42_08425, partial [Desulfobacterales bacterium]|nr:hypothetical protein [Desulfobacterales bacterium]
MHLSQNGLEQFTVPETGVDDLEDFFDRPELQKTAFVLLDQPQVLECESSVAQKRRERFDVFLTVNPGVVLARKRQNADDLLAGLVCLLYKCFCGF